MSRNASINRLTSMTISLGWYLNLLALVVVVISLISTPFLDLPMSDSALKIFSYGLDIDMSMIDMDWESFKQSAMVLSFISLINIVITIYGLYHLRTLYKQISNNQPFLTDSVSRMKKVGITLLIGTIVAAIQVMFMGSPLFLGGREVVEATVSNGSPWMSLVSGFELTAIFYCIIILGFADVFRVGVELQQEAEHTV